MPISRIKDAGTYWFKMLVRSIEAAFAKFWANVPSIEHACYSFYISVANFVDAYVQ